jgi:hypothetical protein
MKYKKDILDVPKHMCPCCQQLCFCFQNSIAFKSCIHLLPICIKDINIQIK